MRESGEFYIDYGLGESGESPDELVVGLERLLLQNGQGDELTTM